MTTPEHLSARKSRIKSLCNSIEMKLKMHHSSVSLSKVTLCLQFPVLLTLYHILLLFPNGAFQKWLGLEVGLDCWRLFLAFSGIIGATVSPALFTPWISHNYLSMKVYLLKRRLYLMNLHLKLVGKVLGNVIISAHDLRVASLIAFSLFLG